MPSAANQKHQPGRRKARRSWAFANSLLASLLAVALTGLSGLLAIRFDWSIEWPLAGMPRVSTRTRDILAVTEGVLRVTCYLERDHALYRPVARMLKGMQAAAAQAGGATLEVVWVDPRRDLAEAARLARLDTPLNALIFEGHGRRKIVQADTLWVSLPAAEGRSGVRRFTGESVSAAVLGQLGRATTPIVYWLTGHGEMEIDDYDPLMGGSDAAREIRREGFELRPLAFWETHRVPADASVLVVAGPRRALTAGECGAIEEYLSQGGRLLYMVAPNFETGLDPIVERWGIRVTPFTAVTPRTLLGQDTVIVHYGDHEITRNFRNTATIFAAPRSLVASERAETNGVDRAQVALLALTGADGWGEATATLPHRFDASTDLSGPVAVAAVSERGGGAGADVAFRPTRVAVFGDAAFAANKLLGSRSGANRDLLINVLNWLSDIASGAAPSNDGDAAFTTGFDRRGWRIFAGTLALGVPAMVLAFGLLVVAVRRAEER